MREKFCPLTSLNNTTKVEEEELPEMVRMVQRTVKMGKGENN